MKFLFNENLNKINDLYSGVKKPKEIETEESEADSKIVFVLPLSGRYEIFLRFLNNFEDVS